MTALIHPETGEVVRELPAFDPNDPASLEAFFGNFGWADHFRKVVLANAREIARAESVATGVKVSEAKLDDLAHTSGMYVDFLIDCLNGRRLREQNAIESLRGG